MCAICDSLTFPLMLHTPVHALINNQVMTTPEEWKPWLSKLQTDDSVERELVVFCFI